MLYHYYSRGADVKHFSQRHQQTPPPSLSSPPPRAAPSARSCRHPDSIFSGSGDIILMQRVWRSRECGRSERRAARKSVCRSACRGLDPASGECVSAAPMYSFDHTFYCFRTCRGVPERWSKYTWCFLLHGTDVSQARRTSFSSPPFSLALVTQNYNSFFYTYSSISRRKLFQDKGVET